MAEPEDTSMEEAYDDVDGAMFTRVNKASVIKHGVKSFDDDTPPLLVGFTQYSVFYHDPDVETEPSAIADEHFDIVVENNDDIDHTSDDSGERVDATENSFITKSSAVLLGSAVSDAPDRRSTTSSDVYDRSSGRLETTDDKMDPKEYFQLTPLHNGQGKIGVTSHFDGVNETNGYTSKVEEPAQQTTCCRCCNQPCCVYVRKFFKLIGPLIFPAVSIGLFLFDIGSDIFLAWTYKKAGTEDDMDYFYVTLACILVPSAIMALVDLSWVWLDRTATANDTKYLLWRIPVGLLSFGKIVRTISFMRHIVKRRSGRQADWHRKRAIEERRDFTMLDFINAFAESAPQLFVQLYILYTDNLQLTAARAVSLFSSWISIAWTYSTYYRCHREALSGKDDVNNVGFAFFFLSVLSALATRVVCIVLFLVHFKHWIGFIVIAGHYVFMLVWIVCQKPKLEGTASAKWSRTLYYLFFAYVSMLYFVNLRNGRARVRMVIFYLIFYVENFALAGLILWKLMYPTDHRDDSYSLLVLPIGCMLHVLLLIQYYKFFHPAVGTCYKNAFTIDADVTASGSGTEQPVTV